MAKRAAIGSHNKAFYSQ